MNEQRPILLPALGLRTLGDLVAVLETATEGTLRRDIVSAVERMSVLMTGGPPVTVAVDIHQIRERLRAIRPAAHNISLKTFSNLRSLFVRALAMVGVVDAIHRGEAAHNPTWRPLVQALEGDKRLSTGLAAFVNWCAWSGIGPSDVGEVEVDRFINWLSTRTLVPKPNDIGRRTPILWNEAATKVAGWPSKHLNVRSFKPPLRRPRWQDLPEQLRDEAEAYLELRLKPDLFAEGPNVPVRGLRPGTVRLQREHILTATSILAGLPHPRPVRCLWDLLEPEAFKDLLRHFVRRFGQKPNAYAVGVARTLLQVGRYTGLPADQLRTLRGAASKLPQPAFDLVEKNKKLLGKLESDSLLAKLLFLPERLLGAVSEDLANGRFRLVDAQVAIAVDIALAAPMRPENLASLRWGVHIQEPNGPKGQLLLHIPEEETKTGRKELLFELPADVAKRLRWYRANVLREVSLDPTGPIFVTRKGTPKAQETLTEQIVERIEIHVGVHMTPHQFRHLAATSYLERHPEDFETARQFLGHSSHKTTLIYAGSGTKRASRVYGRFVVEQRDSMRLKQQRRRTT